jgi:diguanylate cyclase (GGDEF)-like protein
LSSISYREIRYSVFTTFGVVLFLWYLYSIYDDLVMSLESNQKKSIVLTYNVYKELVKKRIPGSLLIENPNYIDNKELIDEMKKSTPLMTELDKAEDVKFDITFKYFDKNKRHPLEIEQLIASLNNNIEYSIYFNKEDQLSLLGKIEDIGYILINQNLNIYYHLKNELSKFIVIFGVLTFLVLCFLYYLNHLKEKLKNSALSLNENYEKIFDDTRKIAFEDQLTGAATRLKFDETLKDLIQVASRFEEQIFTVIMIDIDHFKSVNDTYGHDYGDLVLKKVAKTILQYKKNSETFARWGGEEFIILSPVTKLENSVQFANKLRNEISKIKFEKLQKITCSFGVTEYQIGDTAKTLTKRVDQLLYQAKENGRDRVEY